VKFFIEIFSETFWGRARVDRLENQLENACFIFSSQAPQDYFTRLLSFRERYVEKSQEKRRCHWEKRKSLFGYPFLLLFSWASAGFSGGLLAAYIMANQLTQQLH